MKELIHLTKKDGIARMVIDRPEARNALNADMIRRMTAFCYELENDPAVRCVLITGIGEHFMSGGDVKNFGKILGQDADALRLHLQQRAMDAAPLFEALDRLPQPVVCAVRGYAAGVALSFVAGADLAIASDSARFLLAHVGLGLTPDGACTWHLPRAVGVKLAKQMAFFGDRFDAAEALRMGLVNWVVADAEFEAETERVLVRLVAGPAESIRQSKRLMNRALTVSLADQLSQEALALGQCGLSSDFPEGVRAFLEKRKPDFGASNAARQVNK